MLHLNTIRLVERIYNAPYSYWFLIVKLIYLSWKMDKEHFDDAQAVELATDQESIRSVYGS